MNSILRDGYTLLRRLAHAVRSRSWGLGSLSAALSLPFGAAKSVGTGQVRFPQLGITVPEWASERLMRAHHRLLELKRTYPDSFRVEIHGQDIHLSATGYTVLVHTWGDVDVMHEILVRELYRFHLGQSCVVWDVGMNVGMASLYFAAMTDVKAVHGYELFRPTWEQAQANFALNPRLQERIVSYPCGVGAKAAALDLPYDEELKGVVGLDGPLIQLKGVKPRTECVEVASAVESLAQLRAAHPGLPVVLKMDCEGAEGDILDALEASGVLRDLVLVLLEWHGTAMRKRLERLLVRKGFVTTSQPFAGADVGAMTAVRSDLVTSA